jgi:hypothetical protein
MSDIGCNCGCSTNLDAPSIPSPKVERAIGYIAVQNPNSPSRAELSEISCDIQSALERYEKLLDLLLERLTTVVDDSAVPANGKEVDKRVTTCHLSRALQDRYIYASTMNDRLADIIDRIRV